MNRAALLALVSWLLVLPAGRATESSKPNILLIVADDLGYGDVGCYGATKIKTPNIDRLAGEGVRFTDAHAPAAVCNPSRYAILSGSSYLHAAPHGNYRLYFHEGQVTLPGLLQSAGYRTACIGKWHNGFGRSAEPDWNAELKPGPLEIGFDYFFGTPRTHNEPPFVFVENHRVFDWDPADPIRIVSHAEVLKRHLKDWGWGISEGGKAAHAARPDERLDFIYADKAIDFVARTNGKPFFLYLAFQAPHVPIAPSPEFQGASQAGRYGDFIQQLDFCLGKVLDSLKAQGLADNTLVLFTSDNGAVLHGDALQAGHRANGCLLGQKTDAWEGGHRVPFIARWLGRIPAGTHCDRLLDLTDLMATIAAAAHVTLPKGAAPDSLNQLALLRDPVHSPTVRREMLIEGTGGYALRLGDWAYLPKQGSLGMTIQVPAGARWGQPVAKLGLTNSDLTVEGKVKPEAPPAQLYNLAADIRQATNLFAQELVKSAAMKGRLEELLRRSPTSSSIPKPTQANLPYGPHPRQVLDFWAAPKSSPRPLLVFIHGGGWGAGDKTNVTDFTDIKRWLDKGISVASINYRLTGDAPLPAPVHDAARAIQFLRYQAVRLNLDPAHIALIGSSAGACSALWITLHDDLANAASPDPVAQQSTRVSGAYLRGAQTCIDPIALKEWIGEPAASYPMIYRAVGAGSYAEVLTNYDKYKPLFLEFSPLTHLDAKDPPVMFFYTASTNLPALNWNAGIHHPRFALKFKQKADEVGYSAYSFQYGDEYYGKRMPWPEFLESLLRGGQREAQAAHSPPETAPRPSALSKK